MNKIGEFINERGYTQAELARLLGVSEAMVSLLVHDKRIVSDAMRWRWQEAFGAGALRYLKGDDNVKE